MLLLRYIVCVRYFFILVRVSVKAEPIHTTTANTQQLSLVFILLKLN